MKADTFPMEPSSRRVIWVLEKHEIEALEYEPGGSSSLTDDELYLLQYPIDCTSITSTPLEYIMNNGLCRPGKLLIQNPYDVNSYEDIALAPQNFALTKLMHLSALCKKLGAKEFRVEQTYIRSSNKNRKIPIDTAIRLKKLKIGAKASIEVEELQNFKERIELKDKFPGGPADVDAAETILSETGLRADPNMRNLVEQRRDENLLTERELHVSLSSEARSNFEVAARLGLLDLGKISAESKRVLKERDEFEITVSVQF